MMLIILIKINNRKSLLRLKKFGDTKRFRQDFLLFPQDPNPGFRNVPDQNQDL